MSSASSTASRGSHVPDDAPRLTFCVAPVDREHRHVDAEGSQGCRQLFRDDCVAGVIDRRVGVEDIPDEARAAPNCTAVTVRVLHRHPMESRHDIDSQATHVDPVMRANGDDLAFGDEILHER